MARLNYNVRKVMFDAASTQLPREVGEILRFLNDLAKLLGKIQVTVGQHSPQRFELDGSTSVLAQAQNALNATPAYDLFLDVQFLG